MGNNFQNAAGALSQDVTGIANQWEQISVEKQKIELQSVLSEQEKVYKNFLTEAQNKPGEYEQLRENFVLKQKELRDQGALQVKGGWASRYYQPEADQLASRYRSQVEGLYMSQATDDAKNKAFNLFDDKVNAVGYDKEGYTKEWNSFNAVLGASSLWGDGEKEQIRNKYERAFLNQAVKTGYQAVFAQTDGNYSEKAQAAEQYVLNQDLGKLTADETTTFLSSIKALENQEYTREQRIHNHYDDQLDEEFWQYAKNDDLPGLIEAFGQNVFYDPDRNKYWWSFIQSVTDTPDKDSTAKEEREWAENMVAERKWLREDDQIDQDRMKNEAEMLMSQYGNNPNMAPVFRDFMDYARDPKLSDNPAFSYALSYMEDQVSNMELAEDHPALISTIHDVLQKYAHEEGTDFLQTEEEYRKIVDSLLLEPTIKKMNDTIQSQRFGDQNSLNTSEELTQHFQNGNFKALLEVDESGKIDVSNYKKWLNAWGIRGQEENIEQFITDYMEDFGAAARRDFGTRAMIHVDQQTKRPMVEENGDVYVLHVVDDAEKERLKKAGVDGVKKNDEAWYKWNPDKGEYEYYQGVGRN